MNQLLSGFVTNRALLALIALHALREYSYATIACGRIRIQF